MFTNGLGDRGSVQDRVIPKTQKWYLKPLNTQHYKVSIKGVVAIGVVAIEKGAFGSPTTKVANFTFTFRVGQKLLLNWDS